MQTRPSRRRTSIVLPPPEPRQIQLKNQPESEVTSMSQLAATSAAQPNSSLKAPRVPVSSCGGRNGGCSRPSSHGAVATPMGLRLGRTPRAETRKLTVVHRGAFRLVSRPLLGVTLRGQTGALRLGVVLLRFQRPCGVSVPPRTSLKAAAKCAAQTSSGPRQESTPWHLGAGPTR